MWYGPETMADDEKAIAKGYRTGYWINVIYGGILVGAAYFSEELKFVIVAGFVLFYMTPAAPRMRSGSSKGDCNDNICNEIASRLYDLCIRLRRTNELLSKIDIRRT